MSLLMSKTHNLAWPMMVASLFMVGCATTPKSTQTTATYTPPANTTATSTTNTFALTKQDALQGVELGTDGQPILDAHGNFIPLNPANKGFVVDANGNLVRDANGKPIPLNTVNSSAALLTKRLFNFDYDSSEIAKTDLSALVAHANYLLKNATAKVRVLGHTDERGTPEYNMALGERRTISIADFLVINGAQKSQIDTISYGEVKPLDEGHDETAWAKNRRVEMIYDVLEPKP